MTSLSYQLKNKVWAMSDEELSALINRLSLTGDDRWLRGFASDTLHIRALRRMLSGKTA